jgi:curved DNA-binding protein CbpA
MVSKPDYYKILGVNPKASYAEVKRAYRGLAMRLHPDIDNRPGASDRFVQVKQAYETLSDPQKRAAYDYSLTRPQQRPSAQQATRNPNRHQSGPFPPPPPHGYQYKQTSKRAPLTQTEANIENVLQFILYGVLGTLVLFLFLLPFITFVFIHWTGIFLAILMVPASLHLYNLLNEARKDE